MTLPPENTLRDLSREDLIAIILRLAADVQRLEAEVQRLQAEVDRLKKPPTTSQHSSQPPSRDWKRNAAGRKHHRKTGAKPGHAQAQRALVDSPATVIEARVSTCAACGANLQRVKPVRVLRRPITELPEIKPVVLETRQHEVEGPRCHTLQRGGLPEGLEAQRQFGPRLESARTYFHQEQRLGFERLQQTMRDLFGVTLSEGGEVAILEQAGEAVLPAAEAIGTQVRQRAVIGSDETSVRVHGRNWWEWVFVSDAGEYHLIRPSRGRLHGGTPRPRSG
jgi:transposase